jgi:hypothetical protein
MLTTAGDASWAILAMGFPVTGSLGFASVSSGILIITIPAKSNINTLEYLLNNFTTSEIFDT